VLALGILALAWIARRPANVELRWLVYPALVAAGAKLVVEDFIRCTPAMLVVALALYGTALIVAPRLARPRQQEATPAPEILV